MMDIKKIKALMKIMDKGNLAEIEYEEKDSGVKLVKYAQSVQMPTIQSQPVIQQSQQVVSQAKPKTEEKTKEDEEKYHVIRSPMVGTFYRASSPEADPYVQEGDIVNPETIVCIIESMKVMNEIEAD